MKKKQIFLKTIVAITLLSAMLVSAFLGTSNAEYFKSLNKTLSLEMKPDLNLSYHLYDAKSTTSTEYDSSTGTYKNAASFMQKFTIGADKKKGKTTSNTEQFYKSNKDVYYGETVVYQVKIPVDETGYYNLDFNSYIRFGPDDDTKDYTNTEFYTISYMYCVGCEVLTASDITKNPNLEFGKTTTFNMANRVFKDDPTSSENFAYANEKVLYADSDVIKDSVYQWKTLCPSREENVTLTFKVEDADVQRGYVIWTWDFTGLQGKHNYRLFVNSLDVNKVMNLDGTTATRGSTDPYFMFPQTAYVNNMVDSRTGYSYKDDASRGPGENRYSAGRGTYITSANTNSLSMRAEVLHTNITKGVGNPLTLYVPVKNIYADRTYKVTFDLSIAKQGINAPDYGYANGDTLAAADSSNWHNYASTPILYNGSDANISGKPFQSYLHQGILHQGIDAANTHALHGTAMQQIKYADKYYQNKPLTKYDEFVALSNDLNSSTSLDYTTSSTVNDTYARLHLNNSNLNSSMSRNWFNGVYHIEHNGQYEIPWITFYNTTFSFNIDSTQNSGLTIDNTTKLVEDLYWVWNIDALRYTAYYNIKIENVRIEEVVQYGSVLERNGVKIAGTRVTLENSADYWRDAEDNKTNGGTVINGIFASFRGKNGTGQNWQSKGIMLYGNNDKNAKNRKFTSSMNIYAPIIDASLFPAKHASANANLTEDDDYKITLDGYAICEGGIDRYVFSVDGGETWHDMNFSGGDATSAQWDRAAQCVNQHTDGQTRHYDNFDFYENTTTNNGKTVAQTNAEIFAATTFADFTSADKQNGDFSDWQLEVDLTPFKEQANLDIIIAAVPESNRDLRCEILRIINYNSTRGYATFAQNIISDISVMNEKTGAANVLNARYDPTNNADENKEKFSLMRGVTYAGSVTSQISGYSSRTSYSNDWDDVRTLFSDIPVKTTLKIQGFAMVEGKTINYNKPNNVTLNSKGETVETEGGKLDTEPKYTDVSATDVGGTTTTVDLTSGYVRHALRKPEDYYWTADGGKTWNLCTKSIGGSLNSTFGNAWYSGNPGSNGDYYDLFNGSSKYISANLSAYEGQVVDVIFAAKPQGSDVYVPVAKVDNVAVYGEQGTFFTRVHGVVIDGRTNENPKGTNKAWIEQTPEYSSGNDLDLRDTKWNINYSEKAYVIFEPQNVNAANARYITDDVQEIESAGRVAIDGYVMCKGGVSRYKFSLDGGETWTVINDKAGNMSALSSTHNMIKYSQRSDTSFNVTPDGNNGDFCCTGPGGLDLENETDRKNFYDHALEFNIPALPQNAERDLLVVAENDPDGNPNTDDGKEFPVLHMKIKVKNSKFGYQNITRNADLTKLNVQAGYYSDTNTLTFNPEITNRTGGVHNTLNRITIPVTQTGEHTLKFEHSIYNGPSTYSANRQLYNATGTKNYVTDSKGNPVYTTADITLTANKTHYLVGEQIDIDLDITSSTGAAFGTFQAVIVSEDWVNDSGNQHAIYWTESKTVALDSNKKYTWSADDITHTKEVSPDAFSGPNAGLQSDVKKMGPGKYKIMIIHRAKELLVYSKEKEKEIALPTHDFLRYYGLRQRFLIAEVPIYIHDPDEKVDFSLVHDEGEYTYFSDVSRQLVAEDPNVAHTLRAEDVFGKKNVTNGTITNTLNLNIDVTKGDVRRGYIILDTNYTGLWAGNEHTVDKCNAQHGKNNWGTPEDSNTGHEHTGDKCLSRNPGNDSTFFKKVNGDKLSILDKKFTNQDIRITDYVDGTHYNTAMDNDTSKVIMHTGIDYQVTFNFNAFVKKT